MQSKAVSTVEAAESNGGLFGTAAPRYADVVLLLEIGMGLALLGGAVLARRKRFRPHAWCQSVVVLIAALYILLSAGTNILPAQNRLTRYKHWMRSVLALWWLVLLLGVATYIRWYVPGLLRK